MMNGKTLPSSLDTTSKRIVRARKLIEQRFATKATHGELAAFQGMWSETYIITQEDGHKAVVQFRAEPLDIAPFLRARKLLGTYCPEVELLNDEDLANATLYPVYMSLIPGHSWCTDPKQEKNPDFNVTVMHSLGNVLARCTNDDSIPGVIQNEVIRKLDKRLASERKELDPFRESIRELRAEVETSGLEKLPLFQSHMDLNDMNIMVSSEGEVTGVVDWELSPPYQPFGMGLHRIHDLAGIFQSQVYRQRKEYYEMEAAFWDGLRSGLPVHHRHTIDNNLEAVQLAIRIGTVLWAFDFDSGGEFINPVVVAALPTFLSYRIPALRGDQPAYQNSPPVGPGSRRHRIKK